MERVKNSYYLTKESEDKLFEMYHARLLANRSVRKSHIIDEAIALLYERETQPQVIQQ